MKLKRAEFVFLSGIVGFFALLSTMAVADGQKTLRIDGLYAITSSSVFNEGAVGALKFENGAVAEGSNITLTFLNGTTVVTLEDCDILDTPSTGIQTIDQDGTGTAAFEFQCGSAEPELRSYVFAVTQVTGRRATGIRFQQREASFAGGVLAFDLHALPMPMPK
jgi:hypothetical protein